MEASNEAIVELDYDELIPNNVDLSEDPKLKKALERWQPKYIDWWKQMGPAKFQNADVYLRTAVGVDPKGWAKFGYVKMPEYRWGLLLAPEEENRKIAFGKHKGESVWHQVPGEYRSMIRRLIVIQADTEPASVEQQRYLGDTAPSLYDLRNLFQVNVEEGRHLWAMVYLLAKYFGRDGREEAEELLDRRSGNEDKPRILGAFNERTPDWLSFFMFTYFTDRDGKMQLESLAQSGFDPLSRSCRFMLTEEAHHMFVGESGIRRVITRTCGAMKEAGITDPYKIEEVRKLGVIDLPTLQKRVHFHFSVTLDLFGADISTNAASAFTAGIKGRYHETRLKDDHVLKDDTYPVSKVIDGEVVEVVEPAVKAINSRLIDDYIANAQGGVNRWNKEIKQLGIDFEITLPYKGFHRKIGEFADSFVSTEGKIISENEWQQNLPNWFCTEEDEKFITSLMQPCYETGKYARWIDPPRAGIDHQVKDFEYVKIYD